jgi:hypothetical protein
LIGAAVFGRPATSHILGAAVIGTILPDLSLYLMAAVSLVLLKIPPENVFGELHFSDAWQMVFAIDNSFLIWLGLFALAIWRRSQWAIPLVGAGVCIWHLIFHCIMMTGMPIFGLPRGGCSKVH